MRCAAQSLIGWVPEHITPMSRSPAALVTSATVPARSSRASATVWQMPVMTSTHDWSSSCLAFGWSPSPFGEIARSTSSDALVSCRVCRSTSSSSHSTPRLVRGEELKSMRTLQRVSARSAPAVRPNGSERVGRAVDAPDLAQRVADLADGRPGAQGVLHRVEDVLRGARRGRLQGGQRLVDLRGVPFRPQYRQAFALLGLDRGVDPKRLVRVLLVEGEAVQSDDDALARVDLLGDLVGRPLNLPLLEALLDGGDRTTQVRSEEHTSELQSRRDLVCRLLLEKKKKAAIAHVFIKKKQENSMKR